MLKNILGLVPCRSYTSGHRVRDVKKKIYVTYGAKMLRERKTRKLNSSNMKRIIPLNVPVTARHVGINKIGGSKALAEKLTLHGPPLTQVWDEKLKRYVKKKELVSEFIVPNLEDCELKPYVPYSTPEITQSEFTYKDLFNACYVPQITEDIKAGKIKVDEDGAITYNGKKT